MSYTIATAFFKGGVGKTTTTLCLASSLKQKGKKVLIVDCDPQGNASQTFGLDVRKNENHTGTVMASIAIGEEETKGAIISCIRQYEGIDLLPASHEMIDKAKAMEMITFGELLLARALDYVSDNYDYILIDCPPSLDFYTTSAMIAADWVIIPLQCETYARFGIEKMNEYVSTIKRSKQNNIKRPLNVLGILITNHSRNGRTNIGRELEENIKAYYKDLMFGTEIPTSVALGESQVQYKLMHEYAPYSSVTKAYDIVCGELLERLGDN